MSGQKPTAGKPPGTTVAPNKPAPGTGLVQIFAARYAVEPGSLLNTLRSTAFKAVPTQKDPNPPPVSNEEMMALLVIANEYHLNPFTKEIYAYRARHGGITPIVGFDGWIRMVQNQPEFDGEKLTRGFDTDIWNPGEPDETKREPWGMYFEAEIYRKDRRVPTVLREYFRENWRDTEPWNTMPNRMTRMRSYIQCARVAFGFGGIYDDDEGQKIALSPGVDLLPATPQSPKAHVEAPQARPDAPRQLSNDEHLEMINEKLGKTGIPENLVLAKFEVGALEEIPADRVADVLKFIEDQAP